MVSHACAADASSYWRSTLNARTSTGCRPASSKPPTRKSTRGGSRSAATAATRAGSISRPTTSSRSTSGLSRSTSSSVVTADDAVAEVDDERAGGVAQPGELGGEQPAVDAAQPVGVRRAAGGQPQRAGPAGGQPRGLALRGRGQRGPALVVAPGPRSPVRRVVPASVGSCRFDATSGWRTSPRSASAVPSTGWSRSRTPTNWSPRSARPTRPGARCCCSVAAPTSSRPDDGWPGDVVAVRTRGIERTGESARRPGRRAVGRPGRLHRRATGWPASRRCRASRARPARRRCRTSAPTARRSRRRSPRSGSTTGPRRPSAR